MKTLTLPAGEQYVRFDELAHLIAYAMYPLKNDDSPGDGLNYGNALVSLGAELREAVVSGALPAKNPLTLGPHVMHSGHRRLEDTVVRVADLQAYLGDRLLVESEDSTSYEKSEQAPADGKPVQRSAAQDNAILSEIRKQGFDPLALPANMPGKPGAKSAIRNALKDHRLFTGSTIFKRAWERLTEREEIVIKN